MFQDERLRLSRETFALADAAGYFTEPEKLASLECCTDNCLNANRRRLYSGRSVSSCVGFFFALTLGLSKMSLPHSVPPSSAAPSATRVFLRGLAIALPPILTLVILFWIVHGINTFVIQPISSAVRFSIAHAVQEGRVRTLDGLVKPDGLPGLPHSERSYFVAPSTRTELLEFISKADPESREKTIEDIRKRLEREDLAYIRFGEQAVPYPDYREVAERLSPFQMPKYAIGIYMELAATRYFPSLFHLSAVAVIISIALVYSIGRFVTHRLGAWFVYRTGAFVTGVPLVGEIYSAVKRVTDFFFGEREHTYHRVVALEYPRPGIWSLAFVTGEGMPECSLAAGEPVVNVLIPSTPLPFAGYTMNVKRSELIDLNMTLDQAFQYVMSCGVIVPAPVMPPETTLPGGLREPPALPGQSTQPAF